MPERLLFREPKNSRYRGGQDGGGSKRDELEMPLANLIRDTAHAVVESLGLEQNDALVAGLATRWQRGTLIMQPVEISLPVLVAVSAVGRIDVLAPAHVGLSA